MGWQFRGSSGGKCGGCGVRAGGVGGSGGVTESSTSCGGRQTRSSTRVAAVRRTSNASWVLEKLSIRYIPIYKKLTIVIVMQIQTYF